MERPSLVDSTIAENSILDQAKGNTRQSVTDMRAACDGDTVPMRDDLHQRFPSDGQLLDLEQGAGVHVGAPLWAASSAMEN